LIVLCMDISDHISSRTRRPVPGSDEDDAPTAGMPDGALGRPSLDGEEYERRLACGGATESSAERAELTGDLAARTTAEGRGAASQSEVRAWLDEWRWWLGGASIMSTVWGVQAIRSGAGFYWPLIPLGIWAAVLIAVAVWPRDERS
jgi:hypothetical protein